MADHDGRIERLGDLLPGVAADLLNRTRGERMKITGVVDIDFTAAIEASGGWHHLDTGRREAYALWGELEHVDPPTHVRLTIGTAMSVGWAQSLARAVAECEHVQIVGCWPETVAKATAELQVLVEREQGAVA